MTTRTKLFLLSLSACGLALPLAGCGDFSADEESTGDGDTATGDGDTGTGGTTAGTGGAGAGTGGGDTTGTGGGSDEPPPAASCDDVVGCGGDVAGVWFAVDSCLTVSGPADLSTLGLGMSCTGEANGTLEVSGNWAVDAAGAIITDTTQTTGTINIGLQPDCKEVSGTVTMCDAIGGPLAALGFESVTCVDSTTITDGCDCTGTVNQSGGPGFVTFDPAPEGLYATNGNSLTFSGYEDVDYDYCVDGNFMHLTPTTVSDTGAVTGTIVFQKQP